MSMNGPIEFVRSVLDHVWQWLVGHSKGLSRKELAWGSLGLAGVILLSVNLFTSAALRGWNLDMTEDRLYTISSGTKQILSTLDEPIQARLFFSRRLGESAPVYARYFDRVRALLEQYRDISGGKLDLSILDPEPFSDAEDRAVTAGLRGITLNTQGETGYFGLTATNSTDNEQVVPLFSPDREAFLEYDVTKLVYTLTNPKKRVVGLLTALPMDGGSLPPNMAMGQQAQTTPPWLIMEQIREFFEVVKIDQKATEIPANIDVLMIAQPMGLTPQSAYAVDQFALKGGKVLAFIDPVAEAAQMTLMSQGGEGRQLLGKILKGWGVEFDATNVAADIKNARRVQFGGRDGRGTVTEYIAWLALGSDNMDASDVLANGIEILNIASAGSLSKVEGAASQVTPIIKTSTDAMLIDTKKVGLGTDPLTLVREYKSGGKALMLAARVSGEGQTSFAGGRPFEEDNEAAKNSELAKAPVDEATKAEKLKGHVASGRVNAIVVADSDLLADRFWAERRDQMGQQVVTPISNNVSFVLGALDNLSGSDALIALRGRGVRERRFSLVEDIRRESERRFREKEDGLTKKLAGLQEELAKLETKGGDSTVAFTGQERVAIDKFKHELLTTRRELRDVQLALRHDIDNLDSWLKFANIALVPILLALGGLAWSLWQLRRQKQN